jgi:DNA repair protein SbcD/Mre11
MKLLHTSDWHVGKTLRGADRHEEHRQVLAEIASIAEREEVDLVVVAGDLFDSAAPPPEAEQLVYEALLALARTGAQVTVIAGNHDHPRRLRAVAPLLALGQVHVVTEPTRPDDGGVLELHLADGAELRLALLPFVSKRGIVRAEALMEQPAFELAQAYGDRLRRLIEVMCAGFRPDTINVLAAHAFVLGGQAGGGERTAHLVDEYAVPAAAFPASAGYVALGHLHRAQRVPGGARLHYCGSPLQLDFGEREGAKQVNLVELEPGVPADVCVQRLHAGRRLRTLVGSADELAAAAARDRGDDWLRLIVRDAPRAGLADELRTHFGDRAVDVRIEATVPARAPVSSEPHTRSPQELFAEFLAERGDTDARVPALFAELLDEESAVA